MNDCKLWLLSQAKSTAFVFLQVISPDFSLKLTGFFPGEHFIHFLVLKMKNFRNFVPPDFFRGTLYPFFGAQDEEFSEFCST